MKWLHHEAENHTECGCHLIAIIDSIARPYREWAQRAKARQNDGTPSFIPVMRQCKKT